MGLKKWLQQLRPATLYAVLSLSVVHFLGQMVVCHLTHALTLLLDSCHMLCNIISLVGCLVALKYESNSPTPTPQSQECESKTDSKLDSTGSDIAISEKDCNKEKRLIRTSDEKQLRNTFGWTRIEVLRMLIVCIFFVSLSLSVMVESLQTLIHIDHMGDIRYPYIILTMGVIGLVINIFCYLLIGGFAYHQGSFLHVHTNGEIVLDSVATTDSKSPSPLSRFPPQSEIKQREGFGDIAKDITSCSIVILFAIIAKFVDVRTVKYIDPTLAIISALILLFLNYPYMKESGLILLQTIPNSMNIETLHAELSKSFPMIINIHDFHVWQQTPTKIVLTMHIIFSNPLDYVHHCDSVVKFLLEQGVTEVTIQPEFKSSNVSPDPVESSCLMRCKSIGCSTKHCCDVMMKGNQITSIAINNDKTISSEAINEDTTIGTTTT